jgi:hypothetical protein
VRGTARSSKKAEEMISARMEFSSQLDFAQIDDIGQEVAFHEAIKGVTGVIHVASVSNSL